MITVKKIAMMILMCFSQDVLMIPRRNVLNNRPIIGILSQELSDHDYPVGNFTSYIASSYVKQVEASGARVVPIMIGRSRAYYSDLMDKINGVLFPGGEISLDTSEGYAVAGRHIYEIAKELNDDGDYFPLFGTCLGFEYFIMLASESFDNIVRCSGFGNMPLILAKDFRITRMFKNINNKYRYWLEHDDITIHVHEICITDENLEKYNLTDWKATSWALDNDGLVFIASIENKRYPFAGVQFHPEKTQFEWISTKNFVHTEKAIKVNRHFMDFFVSECRKSMHSFLDEDEENEHLISNYNSYFTGAHPEAELYHYFVECYFFK